MSTAPLFVYGTLRDGPVFQTLIGPGALPPPQAAPATLPGHAVDRQRDNDLPMLLARPGEQAQGTLWHGLAAAQMRRLDAYEAAFGYDLRPVTVMLADGSALAAQAYFPGPGLVSSGEAWSLGDWQARWAAITLMTAQELAAHDPPLEGKSLRRQWPMIWGRAHARHRAVTTPAPATYRHAPAPGDVTVAENRPLQGSFFKLAGLTMHHRRFDGGDSGPLLREVLLGVDAALVLPYDPARDRVLLVEQARPAPARRGDPNPWMLEPVAGIIDAGETPEQAAHRETAEEAGLTLHSLRRMFAIYASPGSTTDHFFCYLGLCDLPDDHATRGGLADEAEDLRLHLLSFDAAMALVDSGEANAGPMVAMLLWLARHRAALRR